jgi:diacylglycerol kinase family enzyme
MTIRRIAIVLNRRAGALLDDPGARDAFSAALMDAGLQADFIPDDEPLPARMARAAKSGADAVVVAGGDGTIACAAQELAGGLIPLGIIPFGTMNLLAKDLQLPIGDIAAALRVVAHGTARLIDAGEVNGHLFLCASMLGLPVRLGRYRESSRGRGWRVWLQMVLAACRLLIRGAPVKGRLEIGGSKARVRATTVTVTVNPVDEESGLRFARTRLDLGQLGIYIVHPAGLSGYAALAVRLALGRWRQDAAVRAFQADAARIDSRRRAIQVMNDGEIRLVSPPLTYRIRPGALLVLAP